MSALPLSLVGAPVTGAATATASTITLTALPASVLIVKNLGSFTVHFATAGTATATGAGRSYAVMPGTSEAFSVSPALSSVSIITASGTSDVQCQLAEGGL